VELKYVNERHRSGLVLKMMFKNEDRKRSEVRGGAVLVCEVCPFLASPMFSGPIEWCYAPPSNLFRIETPWSG